MPFDHGPILSYEGFGRYKTVGVSEYVGKTEVIHIPSDFVTDLASVPRIFWAILPPTGVYERAAVLHDVLCVRLRVAHQHGGRPPQVNARDTDGLFRRVMRECGVGFLTRWAMWTGVRWGALFNPARRAGWICDALAVVGITALGLAALLAFIYGIDTVVHALVRLI